MWYICVLWIRISNKHYVSLRLSGKQDDSLERQSGLFRKLEWHPGKTGILTNMDNTMKEKCPQGVCSGEGEYITHLTCSYGNDLDMYPATTCDCGRKFNSLRGTRIHKARWCEERNSPAGECKSIDGPMSPVYPHSIHKPIADHQRPGDIFCKPRI